MPPKQTAGDKNLKSKSPAEFFLDNKGIAGFENAGEDRLYTTSASSSRTPSTPRSPSGCFQTWTSRWRR